MKDISLKELLEAGCHFGHRVERWHPKAGKYIFQAREGIHIIDLAKTKEGLVAAAQYFQELGEQGKTLLFVGTKRQAKSVVAEAAKKAGASYLTSRWIGGFITNWEEVKKNIDKIVTMRKDRTEGGWTKFPKHEQVKLEKHLRKLESVYNGVVELLSVPDALFIVDIRREDAAVKEAQRRGVKIVAIVDTNADGSDVDFVIPANDDAIGSIQCIVNFLADAYQEGREIAEKNRETAQKQAAAKVKSDLAKAESDAIKAQKAAEKAKLDVAKAAQAKVAPKKEEVVKAAPAKVVKKETKPAEASKEKEPVKKKAVAKKK